MAITKKKIKNVKNVKKFKKYNTEKYNPKHGGADFFGGLVKVPEKKNYSVQIPGAKYVSLLNPNQYMSIKNNKKHNQKKINSDKLKIIFNRQAKHNQIDIANSPNNTTLFSDAVRTEPFLFIYSMGKYLVVMYKEVFNAQNVKIKLLYWLIGYVNYNIKKIFSYIEPDVPPDMLADFTIKIYKLPDNYMEFNLIKINATVNHNSIYNSSKLSKAYNEFFNKYIEPYKLIPTTTINFKVKGSKNQGFELNIK